MKKIIKPLLGSAIFLLIVSIASAAPSFRVDRVYPELGLEMRVLGNSEPAMLPQFKTFTYTYTRGEESFKQNRFDPLELWYADQHCGEWRDSNGNTLVIGLATKQLPSFQEKHVSREEFDKAVNTSANQVDPANQGSLTQWVKSFTRTTPGTPVTLRISSNFGMHSALFIPSSNQQLLIYLFRVKIRTPSGQKVPSDWYCAALQIGDNTDNDKVRGIFENQFLAKVKAAPTAYTTSNASSNSKELKPSRASATNLAIPDSPSREAARKSIASMKDWWFAETMEYIFLSDIRSTTGRTLVSEMQQDMPRFREACAGLIPPFTPLTDANVVRIFENKDAYKQYVGPQHEWSIGLWSPMQRELVILSQGSDKEKTMEIIKHEGFHQYLFFACSMVPNLPWYNEGHACFLETAEIDRRGRVKIHENSRVQHLLRNLETVAHHIPKLLATDHDSFYQVTDELRHLNYTTAWALIYYLRKGAPLERQNPYAEILDNYLAQLKSTRNSSTATTEAFRGINIEKLQEDFRQCWQRQRSKAQNYDPFK